VCAVPCPGGERPIVTPDAAVRFAKVRRIAKTVMRSKDEDLLGHGAWRLFGHIVPAFCELATADIRLNGFVLISLNRYPAGF
jgi:hypothetical protein